MTDSQHMVRMGRTRASSTVEVARNRGPTHDRVKWVSKFRPVHVWHTMTPTALSELTEYEDSSIVGPGAELRRTMQAMLTCVDEATGNLTAALKRHGLWSGTLLVWSSDNGGPQYWAANNHPFRGARLLASPLPATYHELIA